MTKKNLRNLVSDYKNYAFVLLAASVFLYIGVVLPGQGKEPLYDWVMMGTTFLFLVGSYSCFRISLNYKKQLDEQEEL
ncbi:YrhC family protein [Bacillus weihaiensis]|uniref:YrhC-like protein n=1 Tax=Bacillus weihaiensis TaxID=1547283 RepID=A0A1L3MPR6_9BACI|nr:YrhC family protein [Bacillus weihaiensis]APH04302.1 hypothetical protein A9C19_05840 [Bacillus weihaiensis]